MRVSLRKSDFTQEALALGIWASLLENVKPEDQDNTDQIDVQVVSWDTDPQTHNFDE